MNILTTFLYSKFKSSTVLRIASTIMIIGCWFRLLAVINDWFGFVVIGQIIVMAAAPMYLNAISLTANVWFADNERALAGALMTMASPLGSLMSFVI